MTGGLRGECVALANKFRARSAADRMAFVQRANAAKAAGLPSWKAMQRQAAAHQKYGTSPTPAPAPHAGGKAPDTSHAASDAGGVGSAADVPFGDGAPDGGDATCGVCAEEPPIAAAGAGFGRANLDRAAATRAGFVDSQETTHGLSMAELRAKLSEAGVGVRMASTSADLW